MEQQNRSLSIVEVAEDLRRLYPGSRALLALSWDHGRKHTECEGNLADLLERLQAFCEAFPQVLVHYQPRHPYGFVCRAVCPGSDADAWAHAGPTARLFLTGDGCSSPELGVYVPPR